LKTGIYFTAISHDRLRNIQNHRRTKGFCRERLRLSHHQCDERCYGRQVVFNLEIMTTDEKIEKLRFKYDRYLGNITWHIKTNKPTGDDLTVLENRCTDIKEFIQDLCSLKTNQNHRQSPTP